MTDSQLLSEQVWRAITRAARATRKPAFVAVAYFGQNASKLLPLPEGSWLVVDLSKSAIKSGQTHPADVKRLQDRGVTIFNRPFLHAKVFAFEEVAFVGSTNVSRRSSQTLKEAAIRTSNPKVVRSAKKFAKELCRDEVTPGQLNQLQKLYRPPRIPQAIAESPKKLSVGKDQGRLFLAQLHRAEPPPGSESASEAGMRVAKSRRQHPRSYILADYFKFGRNVIRSHDKVIQIVEEPDGRRMVDAPGVVLNTRTWQGKQGRVTFVYLEHPDVKRIQVDKLAKRLGYGAKKKLSRDGLIRDRNFSTLLLANWTKFGG